MNKIISLLLILFSWNITFSQSDENPVFNSVIIEENDYNDYTIVSNYYTLHNNIENTLSSVYISEKPTLNQIEDAALNLPSDFFIITKDRKVAVMIMIEKKPNYNFIVLKSKSGQNSNFECNLKGDISENRANEIIKNNYDSKALIHNGTLIFNNKKFKIISNEQIEEAVLNLIKTEKLNEVEPSEIIIPSQKEIKSYILTESKEGGDLDFFTEIKGKEYDGVQIKPGVFTTLRSIALYQWGRACFDIGVNTVEDAYQIYSEYTEKTINERDKEYIRMGFYKEWEK